MEIRWSPLPPPARKTPGGPAVRAFRNGKEFPYPSSEGEEWRASYTLLGAHPRISLAYRRGIDSFLPSFIHSPSISWATTHPGRGPPSTLPVALRVTQGMCQGRGEETCGGRGAACVESRNAQATRRRRWNPWPSGITFCPQALPWGWLC